MRTVTIEIKNNATFNLLSDLERMSLLKIVKSDKTHTPVNSKEQKLSERFAGSLSGKRTKELQKELIQMRNEWN
jgi:hypothetical protein